jgi:VWFA-related protein
VIAIWRVRSAITLCVLLCAGLARTSARQTPIFRANGSIVTVDAIVRNGNVLVSGLTPGDFVLTDNGVPQVISAIATESVPIDLTLVLDISGSTDPGLPDFKDDIRGIVRLLRDGDRVRLMTSARDVRQLSGFVAATSKLPLDDLRSDGPTALLDGILFGLQHTPAPDRQHLIVVFSDGGENESVISGAMLTDAAARADGLLHIILSSSAPPSGRGGFSTLCRDSPDDDWKSFSVNSFGSKGPCPSSVPFNFDYETKQNFVWRPDRGPVALRNDRPRQPASTTLSVLPLGQLTFPFLPTLRAAAEITGGGLHAGISPSNLVKGFKSVFDEFRHSYVLHYSPVGVTSAGWHDVVVTVPSHPGFEVTARKRYFGG